MDYQLPAEVGKRYQQIDAEPDLGPEIKLARLAAETLAAKGNLGAGAQLAAVVGRLIETDFNNKIRARSFLSVGQLRALAGWIGRELWSICAERLPDSEAQAIVDEFAYRFCEMLREFRETGVVPALPETPQPRLLGPAGTEESTQLSS